jgi:membrane fusion protein, multidrug efflux system
VTAIIKRSIFIIASLAASGCKSDTNDIKAQAVPRPVLTVLVTSTQSSQTGFAGTIQARYQTDRGFQVLGRLITRDVNVGDVVSDGQQLATVDPLIFDLAVRSSEAELLKAQAGQSNAIAAEERKTELRNKEVVSQAAFETAQQFRASADALVKQAEANLAKAREQRRFTVLKADIAGVVLTTDAEVGQTLAAGRSVLTLARTDTREAVVDVPEAIALGVGKGTEFDIKLQSDASVTTKGKLREIAPEADSSTRLRRVKITLDSFVEAFRFGATVTAFPKTLAVDAVVAIPRDALLDREGATKVWLVDAATKTVKTVTVEVSSRDGQHVQVSGGLPIGSRIVVAGVNSLSEGQVVKTDERVSR